jgi:aldose 1-epimerase
VTTLTVDRFGTTVRTTWRPAADVELVAVTSSSLSLRLLTLGAAIHSLEAPDGDGRLGPVHLSLPSLADYEDPTRNPHLGASIGRYANRISGSRFVLDGSPIRVIPNEGPNQLHGGPVGFDRRVWELVGADPGDDGGRIVFRLVSPPGDQGFPGTVVATATYELEGACLRITYRATTDAPTVVNLTNHGYWNLEGSGVVDEHRLALAAERLVPVDPAGIPTGGLQAVDGTCFDLRSPTVLGPAMAACPSGGFDHCFAVDGPDDVLRPAAVLAAPTSGRWMTVRTNRPGVQLYTGDDLQPPFPIHGSVSLETQRFPDTPNRPELGSAVLHPGQVDESVTELCFGAGTPPTLDRLGMVVEDRRPS